MNPADIRQTIRGWILSELLPGEEPENLSDNLSLRDAGILDSLSTIQLVDLLENSFGIEVGVNETVAGNFATINRLVEYVNCKVSADVG
ncbi:MAG: acyl carrier protein [Actinobacteria bacterium]|nr:acyl carrier protein [Actinomycetota bacterium]